MGIADGAGYLFVSNSRRQTHAVYERRGHGFADARRGWGAIEPTRRGLPPAGLLLSTSGDPLP